MRKVLEWAGLLDPSGRRAWAFLSLLFGCGIMTAFAAAALYIVRADKTYSFYLGLAAHVQIFVALSGFMAMFVKREYEIDAKDGKVAIKDIENVEVTYESTDGDRRVSLHSSPSGSASGGQDGSPAPDQDGGEPAGPLGDRRG